MEVKLEEESDLSPWAVSHPSRKGTRKIVSACDSWREWRTGRSRGRWEWSVVLQIREGVIVIDFQSVGCGFVHHPHILPTAFTGMTYPNCGPSVQSMSGVRENKFNWLLGVLRSKWGNCSDSIIMMTCFLYSLKSTWWLCRKAMPMILNYSPVVGVSAMNRVIML